MKKAFYIFLTSLILMFCGISFSACTTSYEISISDYDEENPILVVSNSGTPTTVEIKVSGGDDTPMISWDKSLLNISNLQKVASGRFTIDISSVSEVYDHSKTTVSVLYPNAKTKTFDVVIKSRLDSDSVAVLENSKINYIIKGQSKILYAKNYFNIEPASTSYTEEWSCESNKVTVAENGRTVTVESDYNEKTVTLDVKITQNVDTPIEVNEKLILTVLDDELISVYETPTDAENRENALTFETGDAGTSANPFAIPKNVATESYKYVYLFVKTGNVSVSPNYTLVARTDDAEDVLSVMYDGKDTVYADDDDATVLGEVYTYKISADENSGVGMQSVKFYVESDSLDLSNEPLLCKTVWFSTYNVPTTTTLYASDGKTQLSDTKVYNVYTSYASGVNGFCILPKLATADGTLTGVDDITYNVSIDNDSYNNFMFSYLNGNGLITSVEFVAEGDKYVATNFSSGRRIYVVAKNATAKSSTITIYANANENAFFSVKILGVESDSTIEYKAIYYNDGEKYTAFEDGIKYETSTEQTFSFAVEFNGITTASALSSILATVTDPSLTVSSYEPATVSVGDLSVVVLLVTLSAPVNHESSDYSVVFTHENGATASASLKFYIELLDDNCGLSYEVGTNVLKSSTESITFAENDKQNLLSIVANYNSTIKFVTKSNSSLTKITYASATEAQNLTQIGTLTYQESLTISGVDDGKTVSYLKLENNVLSTYANDCEYYLYFKFSNDATATPVYRGVHILVTETASEFLVSVSDVTLNSLDTLSEKFASQATASVEITLRADDYAVSNLASGTKIINWEDGQGSTLDSLRKDDASIYYILRFKDASATTDHSLGTGLKSDFFAITNVEIKDKTITFKITALSTLQNQSITRTLQIELISAYGTRTDSVVFRIDDAVKVEKVEFLNKPQDDEIVLNVTSSNVEDKKFTVITKVYNDDALDKSLKYVFDGNNSNITLKDNVISADSTTVGGYGYLYILPADMVHIDGQEQIYYYKEADGKITLCTHSLSDIKNVYAELMSEDAYFLDGDGNKVQYSEVVLKIYVVAVDGLSVTTALRIYDEETFASYADTNSNFANMCFKIMKDITLSNDGYFSSTFYKSANEFDGIIYGNTEDVTITVSHTCTETDSFAVFVGLGENAQIYDITFGGVINIKSSSATGFIAGTNKGTLINVKVDFYSNGTTLTASTLTVKGANASGLVGVNSGKIEDCAVLGLSITVETNNVAGLVYANSGTISGCRVEIYTLEEEKYSTFSGSGVAGLVYNNTGKLEKSFIFAYPVFDSVEQVEFISATNVYGIIFSNSETGTIDQCFAVIGSYDSKFTDNTAITNSYELYKSGDNILAKYSSDGVTDAYESYANAEGKYSEYLALLIDVKQDDYVSSIDPKLAEDVDNAFVDVAEKTLVLMYTSVSGGTTSTYAQQELEKINTFYFKDLFKNWSSNMIVSMNETSAIVDLSSQAIVVKGKGETITLIIKSKQNATVTAEILIKIIGYIQNPTLYIDNNLVENNEVRYVQTGKSFSITASIAPTLYIGSDTFSVICEDYTLVVYLYDDVALETVKESGTDITTLLEDEIQRTVVAEAVVSGISKKFSSSFTIVGYYGASDISTTTTAINLKGNKAQTLELKIVSDSTAEGVVLTSQDGVVSSMGNGSYEIAINSAVVVVNVTNTNSVSTDTNKTYDVTFSLKEPNTISENFSFDVVLLAKTNDTLYKTVTINVLTQEVETVYSNYYAYNDRWLDSNENVYKYTYQQETSSSFAPDARILQVLNVANDACFDHIILSSQGDYARFRELSQSGAQNYVQTSNQGKSINISQNDNGEYYIEIIASSVTENITLCIYIDFYYADGTYKRFTNAISIEVVKTAVLEYQNEDETLETSNMISKGSSGKLVITLSADTVLRSEKVYLTGVESGIYITQQSKTTSTSTNTTTYTFSISASVLAKLSGGADTGAFEAYVEVYKIINGKTEYKKSTIMLYLVDFVVTSTSASLVNKEDSTSTEGYDIFKAYLSFSSELEFEYDILPEEYTNSGLETELSAIKDLTQKRTSFLEQNSYADEDSGYYINYRKNQVTGSYEEVDIRSRLYYVSSVLTPIYNTTTEKYTTNSNFGFEYNNGKLYVYGTLSGTRTMCLRTYITIAGIEIYYDYYFVVSISVYIDDENAVYVDSAEKFVQYFTESTEATNYILTANIVLEDYKTIDDTSLINSLDGNGYVIYIKNYAESESNTYALFDTITSNTILKNLKVNVYSGGQIDVDISDEVANSTSATVSVAGLAITNKGTIYNCEVVSYYDSTVHTSKLSESGIIVKFYANVAEVDLDASIDVESNIAGMVVYNKGVITNSRVGGSSIKVVSSSVDGITKVKDIELETFNIHGQGQVSGFVIENDESEDELSSAISSCYAQNIDIENAKNDQECYTAGFVIENNSQISTSFVEGVKRTGDDADTRSYTGSYIIAKGIVSGFVIENNSNIKDCYSNIAIDKEDVSQSYIASGFVYTNSSTALAARCFSACKIFNDNSLKLNFGGVDKSGQLTSLASTFENCYFYNEGGTSSGSNTDNTEVYYGTNVTEIQLEDGSFDIEDFYGFAFGGSTSSSGIWKVNSATNKVGDITLSSANEIAFSNKYVKYKTGSTEEYSLMQSTIYDESSNIEYVADYGSENNPIIIRDESDFVSVFGGDGDATSTSIASYCNLATISGHYRLLSDIDLSGISSAYPSTTRILTGMFDGNGFTISGISIGSDTKQTQTTALGLFKAIDGAIVRSVSLSVVRVENDMANAVGTLAGVVVDSGIYGVNVECEDFNTTNYDIVGKNFAGGVAGLVLGQSQLKNITVTDISVAAEYVPSASTAENADSATMIAIRKNANSLSTLESTLSTMRFAGGVAGYVDIFELSSRDDVSFVFAQNPEYDNYQVNSISYSGGIKVSAGVSGGIFGFLGSDTYATNLTIVLDSANKDSKISATSYAGGIVGQSLGAMTSVVVQYDEATQQTIEDNKYSYYNGDTSVERGSETLFESCTGTVGGLVGLANLGFIYVAYNKLNVIASKAIYAGGIVGSITNQDDAGTFAMYKCSQFDDQKIHFFLKEVYASGDVYAGAESGYTGGIIGYNHAKTILYYVNSVNYFAVITNDGGVSSYKDGVSPIVGVDDQNDVAQNLVTGNTNVADKDVLAVLEYTTNDSEDTRTILLCQVEYNDVATTNAKSVEANRTVGVADNASLFAYTDEQTKNSQNQTINVFTMASAKTVANGTEGYQAYEPAFIKRGWSEENWVHNQDDYYPVINYTGYNSYVILDAYEASIERVYNAIKSNSSINIRLRGEDEDGTAYYNVDIATWCDKNSISIADYFQGWHGKMTWYKTYLSSSTNTTKADRVGIIVDKTMFGAEAYPKLYDINIIYIGTEITNSIIFTGTAKTATLSNCYIQIGGTYEWYDYNGNTTEAKTSTLTNVNITLTASTETSNEQTINGGLLAAEAENCNFVDNDILLYDDLTFIINQPTGDTTSTINFGLLVGHVVRNPSFATVSLTSNKIHNSKTITVNYQAQNPINFGGYFGCVEQSNKNATVVGATNITATPIGKITFNATSNIIGDVNLGGAVGRAISAVGYSVTQRTTGDKAIASTVYNTEFTANLTGAVGSSGSNYNVCIGGIVGYASGTSATISCDSGITNASVSLNAKTTGEIYGNLYLGGIAGSNGSINSMGSEHIKLTMEATVNTVSEDVYYGGYFGQAGGGSISVSTSETPKLSVSNANNVYAGGIVGNSTSALSIELNQTFEFKANITATNIYAGGLMGSGKLSSAKLGSNGVTFIAQNQQATTLYLGGIVGNSSAETATTISSSSTVTLSPTSITVKENGSLYVGGIAGQSNSNTTLSVTKTNFNGCTFSIEKGASVYIGGAIGNSGIVSMTSGGTVNFSIGDNLNLGTATSLTAFYVGGIAGCANGGSEGSSESDAEVKNITVNGGITISGYYVSEGEMYVGGMFGKANYVSCIGCTENINYTIKDTNTGDTIYFGGIAGYVNKVVVDTYSIGSAYTTTLTDFATVYAGQIAGSVDNLAQVSASTIKAWIVTNYSSDNLDTENRNAINPTIVVSNGIGQLASEASATVTYSAFLGGYTFDAIEEDQGSIAIGTVTFGGVVGGASGSVDIENVVANATMNIYLRSEVASGSQGVSATSLTYGGIVANCDGGGKIDTCAVYGDFNANITKTITFGGIVGKGISGLTLSNCVSMVGFNNAYYNSTTSDNNVAAIIGNINGTTGSGNSYASGLSLLVQDDSTPITNEDGSTSSFTATDLPYGTNCNYAGYEDLSGSVSEKTNIITMFNNVVGKISGLNVSHNKLNPSVFNGSVENDTYYYLSGDYNLNSALGDNSGKIVGNGFTITTSAYNILGSASLSNAIVSVSIAEKPTEETYIAVLYKSMDGKVLFGVGVVGTIEVQGDQNVNVAGITTALVSGRIDNCYTDLTITYMAKADASSEVSSFAHVDNNYGTYSITNSFAVGKIITYSTCTPYQFSGELIGSCYTEVSIVAKNYEGKVEGKDNTKNTENAYNYLKESKLGFGADTTEEDVGTGWVANTAYNYGYKTRRFGFLRNVTTYTYTESNISESYSEDTTYTTEEYSKAYAKVAYTIVRSETDISNYYFPSYDATTYNALAGGYNTFLINNIDGVSSKTNNGDNGNAKVLDGCGYSLKLNAGSLFSGTNYGTIKNLSVSAITGSAGNSAISGISNINNGTILRVTAQGTISVSGESSMCNYYGGITGYNNGVVNGCKNLVTITITLQLGSDSYVGGIAGLNDSLIKNCINGAPIKNNATDGGVYGVINYAGGIAGYSSGQIINVDNASAVESGYSIKACKSQGAYYAGGIVGKVENMSAQYTATATYIAQSCKYSIYKADNTGIVKAGEQAQGNTCKAYAGGIFGYAEDACTIDSVSNSGSVEALSQGYKEGGYTISETVSSEKKFLDGVVFNNLTVDNSVERYKYVYWNTESISASYKKWTYDVTINVGRLVYAYGIGYGGTITNYYNDPDADINNTGRWAEDDTTVYSVTLSNDPDQKSSVNVYMDTHHVVSGDDSDGTYVLEMYTLTEFTGEYDVLATDSSGLPTNIKFETTVTTYSRSYFVRPKAWYDGSDDTDKIVNDNYGIAVIKAGNYNNIWGYHTNSGIKTWSQNRDGYTIKDASENDIKQTSVKNKFYDFEQIFCNQATNSTTATATTTTTFYTQTTSNSSQTKNINGASWTFTNGLTASTSTYTYTLTGTFANVGPDFDKEYVKVSGNNVNSFYVQSLTAGSDNAVNYSIVVNSNSESLSSGDVEVTYEYKPDVDASSSANYIWEDSSGNVYISSTSKLTGNYRVNKTPITLEFVNSINYNQYVYKVNGSTVELIKAYGIEDVDAESSLKGYVSPQFIDFSMNVSYDYYESEDDEITATKTAYYRQIVTKTSTEINDDGNTIKVTVNGSVSATVNNITYDHDTEYNGVYYDIFLACMQSGAKAYDNEYKTSNYITCFNLIDSNTFNGNVFYPAAMIVVMQRGFNISEAEPDMISYTYDEAPSSGYIYQFNGSEANSSTEVTLYKKFDDGDEFSSFEHYFTYEKGADAKSWSIYGYNDNNNYTYNDIDTFPNIAAIVTNYEKLSSSLFIESVSLNFYKDDSEDSETIFSGDSKTFTINYSGGGYTIKVSAKKFADDNLYLVLDYDGELKNNDCYFDWFWLFTNNYNNGLVNILYVVNYKFINFEDIPLINNYSEIINLNNEQGVYSTSMGYGAIVDSSFLYVNITGTNNAPEASEGLTITSEYVSITSDVMVYEQITSEKLYANGFTITTSNVFKSSISKKDISDSVNVIYQLVNSSGGMVSKNKDGVVQTSYGSSRQISTQSSKEGIGTFTSYSKNLTNKTTLGKDGAKNTTNVDYSGKDSKSADGANVYLRIDIEDGEYKIKGNKTSNNAGEGAIAGELIMPFLNNIFGGVKSFSIYSSKQTSQTNTKQTVVIYSFSSYWSGYIIQSDFNYLWRTDTDNVWSIYLDSNGIHTAQLNETSLADYSPDSSSSYKGGKYCFVENYSSHDSAIDININNYSENLNKGGVFAGLLKASVNNSNITLTPLKFSNTISECRNFKGINVYLAGTNVKSSS